LRTFRHVLLPSVLPAVVSGAALSFARALGEYGSVVLISGNLPGRSLVAPTLIVQQIEEHRTEEAVAVALVLLTLAFATLALFHIVQRWGRRHDA
jgi:sulfate transport system permease protein